MEESSGEVQTENRNIACLTPYPIYLSDPISYYAEALITDAVKEISRTEEESEKYANDFADKIEKEKETLKYDEAQKKVREFFGYDNYVFSDKTKNKKPT